MAVRAVLPFRRAVRAGGGAAGRPVRGKEAGPEGPAGGGQDLIAHDNIVINSSEPVSFDARALTGLSGDESSSFYQEYKEGGRIWQLLYDSPWQSEAWQKAYPQYRHYSDDFSDTENPDFVLNPAHNSLTRNIFISAQGTIGWVADEVYRYSDISDNACFKLSVLKKLFVDPANGDYTLRDDAPIGFDIDVPAMSEFGRQPAGNGGI